jgi:hypothetical protein
MAAESGSLRGAVLARSVPVVPDVPGMAGLWGPVLDTDTPVCCGSTDVTMNALLRAVAILSLVAIVAAAIANFGGWITLDRAKVVSLAATVVWFIAATPWLGKSDGDA